MTHENGRSSFIVDQLYIFSIILFVGAVVLVGSAVYGEYKSTHCTEYETCYENGYADGMIEHLDERYVLCKEYIADTRPMYLDPRMRGYSEGYVKGYEEWVISR